MTKINCIKFRSVLHYKKIMTNIKIDNFIKNSAIIAISNKITLLQRKLFNFFIAHAYSDLDKQETFEINLSDLKTRLWFDSKNIWYLKESIKWLMSTVVEFNLLWKEKEVWSATSLLADVTFNNGICTYSFSPVLRKKMRNPNIYAKIKLSLMKLFSSKYSLCLYEIFVDYHHIWQTPIIKLETFRELMWIEKKQYLEFKRLSSRVIKPAMKEVQDIWWYEIEVHYIKESRKIVALKFTFKAIVKQQMVSIQNKLVTNPALQHRLIQGFWLTLRQTKKILETYPEPYIKESLDIIQSKISKKLIKNIPWYTITVLKNDYVPIQNNKAWSNIKKESILWDSKKSWQNRKTKMALSKDSSMNVLPSDSNSIAIRQNQEKAYQYFQSLDKEKQNELIKKFEDEKITSDILKTLYKKEGLKSPIFKITFEDWLLEIIKNKITT